MSDVRRVFCADSARITVVLLFAAAFAGCVGPSAGEKSAQRDVATIGRELGLSPDRASSNVGRGLPTSPSRINLSAPPPSLPALQPDSPEADYVRFALYNHPAVRAAYYDWKAAVAAIAPARALPDPQLTFQADIADTLMSFMPGLMVDVMALGKRQAMAREANATADVAYRTYVAEVVKTAGAVRKAWVELAYAHETDRLYQQTIHTADQAVALAGADYTTGRGMPNFEQQVRFQNLLAQHHAHHAAVSLRITAAHAKLKSVLGLLPTDADPAWPKPTLDASRPPNEDELWARIQTANPDLAKMRSMVDMAVASVDVAKKGGTPDFTAGLMVDTKQDPLMFRPTATVTLPIWREKIRSNISAAEARRDAAAARVTVEQLSMAAELAQMLYMIRESDSMLLYMNASALPNLDRSLASAEAAVQSGMGNSIMIAEVQLMAIDMRHERLDALRDRENAVVGLALMMADVLPEQAPVLQSSEHRSAGSE